MALDGVAAAEAAAPPLAPSTSEMPRMLRALRHRDFRLFWTGNFLSNIGTWMQNMAQGWLVLRLVEMGPQYAPALGGLGHNGAFWLGVVGFAASAPMLVFTLIGGVIADQVDRRRLMMRTQSAMMVVAFLLAFLTWKEWIDVPAIVLLASATGVAMALNTPSYQALVPHLIPREDLVNAIALNSAQFNLSRVLGPMLGGFAMAWFGIAGNFFLNGLSFLAVLFALSRIKYPAPGTDDGSATMWQRLAEGFRYVFEKREMLGLVSLVGLASTFGISYLVFIPLFAREILRVDERGFGLLMACSGLGSFLGAATLAYTGGSARRKGKFVVRSGVVFFSAITVFSLSRNFYLSAAMLMVVGFAMILMVATVNALLQHLAKEEMRGRVMSIYATAFLGFAPIGSLIAGSLAGMVTAPYAIAGMSLFALVATVSLYFGMPELRRLD